MIGLSIKAAKGGFFDRKKVVDAVHKANRKALSKAGAFVRQRAKTSMRRRKGTSSPPGVPPYAHVGLIRKFLFFSYDQAGQSVVVGPARINRPSAGRYTTPELHEYGGSVPGNGRVIWITQAVGRDTKGKFVSRGKKRVKLDGTLRYEPRPFMRPALAAELPKLPPLWRDSVR
jgi:hypothetical protein